MSTLKVFTPTQNQLSPAKKKRSAAKCQVDLNKFIDKFQPSKFKKLKDGIEIRSVYDIPDAISKAKCLIATMSLKLQVVHSAEMAAYRAFEIREL